MNIKFPSNFFKSCFGLDSNETKSSAQGRPHSRSAKFSADPRFPSRREPAGASFTGGRPSASTGSAARPASHAESGPRYRSQTAPTGKTNYPSQGPTGVDKGAGAAKAAAGTPAQNLLREFSIRELDAMTDKHWQTALAILGAPHTSATSGVPLASNWRRLRSEFNAVDAAKVLLSNTEKVLEILLEPPKSPKSPPRTEQQGTAQTKPSVLPPISIVGMGKETARQALRERGMSMEQLKQMKFDFHHHVNHGDKRNGELLNKKYGAYISDDFSSSVSYTAYAKMLNGL